MLPYMAYMDPMGYIYQWFSHDFPATMTPPQDLCDRLLERGVLVYDSARELLAIDVRQRKEQLAAEDGGRGAGCGGPKGDFTREEWAKSPWNLAKFNLWCVIKWRTIQYDYEWWLRMVI